MILLPVRRPARASWVSLLLLLATTTPLLSLAQAPVWAAATSFNPAARRGASNAFDVAVDVAGNQYVTGSFSDTLRLGGATLIAGGIRDIFVAKQTPGGIWLWAV